MRSAAESSCAFPIRGCEPVASGTMSMAQLIVEADGGSRGNPGPAAFGAVVRSASGDVLAEVGETIGVATNNVAEYRGLIAGLRMAHAIDPSAQVEARLDSKLVVEQMSGRWKIKNADLRPLALEAQRIFPPEQVTYTWVPRAENAHADQLLNRALDGNPCSMEGPPGGDQPGGNQPDGDQSGAGQRSGRLTVAPVATAPPMPDLGPPTTLLLVRHGQTPMTVARAYSGGGVEGPPLDDAGRTQAEHAGQVIAGRLEAAAHRADVVGSKTLHGGVPADDGPVPVPLVVASPMLRTRQTADLVADRLGVEKVHVDEEWRECEFGEWEGLTLAEIGERYPQQMEQWFASTSFRAPGGESLDEMTARIAAARDRLVTEHQGRIIVAVTHSMPVRALVRMALEASPVAMFRMRPAPGSVSELHHYRDGEVVLNSFNHHL